MKRPGVKIALGAEGGQFTLHSLRGPRFMLDLFSPRVSGVRLVVNVMRGQRALTFNLRCTEVFGIPNSQQSMRSPWPNW